MGCGKFHLVNTSDINGCKAIYQGLSVNHAIYTPNQNLTGKTLIGEIRSNRLDDSGKLIASFNFSTPVYNASIVIPGYNNGVAVPATLVYMSLSAAVTKNIKAPLENLPETSLKNIDKFAEIGVNCWVYDVRAIDNSDPTYGLGIIEDSFVQIVERVTE